jgi:drug/metabolite transporter (DMT)-like permease
MRCTLWIVIPFFRGEKLARLAILGLIISFAGVVLFTIIYLILSSPIFDLVLCSFMATISGRLVVLYVKKKAATFNLL